MKQIQKYTMKNIEYYYGYVYWLHSQDWTKLKFMDKVHFVARGTFINLFIINLIKINQVLPEEKKETRRKEENTR